MIASETIFGNLLNLLAATQLLTGGVPSGGPVFLTHTRRLPQVSDVGQAIQPALYLYEGPEIVTEKAGLALTKFEIRALIFIFFRNVGGPNEVASTQLNGLRDAVIYQMEQQTLAADGITVQPLLAGNRQTLGGVCYHARVLGTIIKNEGTMNQQGAIVFPISILSGM